MKRSYLIALILLSAPLVLSAQSVWEGSAAVGGYGSFPSTGLYGASDSFSQNTLVTVENPQT
ncbi:MAG TPA: SPOR domain-containing protein, partial [Spirochaetia bacterium]|nr:SPOR domain-containing protein [Spirochaetia bacterium]